MLLANRLRTLRAEKQLSQGDIQQRTGLLRCYISRVENGHTVPAIETLEKLARALEVPLYQLFYEGEKLPSPPGFPISEVKRDVAWGTSGKSARMLNQFREIFSRTDERNLRLILSMARKMARPRRAKNPARQ